MNNFKIIYKILRLFERALDYEEFDVSSINATDLGISKERLDGILRMLVDDGYLLGIIYKPNLLGVKITKNARITLRGLEYLEENSLMKKASDIAKGIIDVCT